VIIRPAVVEDVPAVAELEAALFGVDAWSAESVTDELTEPSRLALVACDGEGTVMGYAVVMQVDEVLDLHRVAVAPSLRRTGVGRALLAEAQRTGRARGARRMLLEVSAVSSDALAFYEAAGFVEIDRRPRYYRDGSDALVLRLDLGDEGS
jgi:[ribosomal protein S18]-alanine N-acetyltransferase